MPGVLSERKSIIPTGDVQRAAQNAAYKKGILADIPPERLPLLRWQERQEIGADLPLESVLCPASMHVVAQGREIIASMAKITDIAIETTPDSIAIQTPDRHRSILIQPNQIIIVEEKNDDESDSVTLHAYPEQDRIELFQHTSKNGTLTTKMGSLPIHSGIVAADLLTSLSRTLEVRGAESSVVRATETMLDNFRPADLQKYSHEADAKAPSALSSPALPQRATQRGSLAGIDGSTNSSPTNEGIGPKLRAVLREPHQWVEIPEELQRAIDGHRASLRKQGFQDPRPDNVLAQEIALKRGIARYRQINGTNKTDEEIIPLLDKKSTALYGMPEWLRVRVKNYQRTHRKDTRSAEAIARQFAREEMTGISPEMKPLVREHMQSHPEDKSTPFDIEQRLNSPREYIPVSQAEFTQMLERVIADHAAHGILPPTMAKLIPQARELMKRLAAHPQYQILYPRPQTSFRGEQIANIFEVIRRFGPTFQEPEREEPVITGEPFYRDEFGEFRRLLDRKRLPTRWVPIQQGSMPIQPQMEVEIKPANPPTRPHIEDAAADSMQLSPRPQLQFWPRNIPAALEDMYAGFRTFHSFAEDAKIHGKVHRHAPQGGISSIDIDNDTHRVRIDIDIRSKKVVAVRYGPISAPSQKQIENISQILGNIRPLDGLLVHHAERLSDLRRQHPQDEGLRITRDHLKIILEDLDQREQTLLANRMAKVI